MNRMAVTRSEVIEIYRDNWQARKNKSEETQKRVEGGEVAKNTRIRKKK